MTRDVPPASSGTADDVPVSELVVRELRLRGFDDVAPAPPPGVGRADKAPARQHDATPPRPPGRLAARHSSRRGRQDELSL